MAGFVEHLLERDAALSLAVTLLELPNSGVPKRSLELAEALGALVYGDVKAADPYPPYPGSTRDGYAVAARDTWGASPSSPVFLSLAGEVPMGALPAFPIRREECALIHTGGAVPEGADSVVMLEDAAAAGSLIEVRRSVQGGENIVRKGEEYASSEVLLPRGTRIDSRAAGILASQGLKRVDAFDLKVGILSSGDEIVDIGAAPSPGKIRDVNAWTLQALLREQGYTPVPFGIASDDAGALQEKLDQALEVCPVVLVSGGSSVSARDFTPALLEKLPPPGLIVRGLNLAPGKPTLIAGSLEPRRLVVGLPGHPLSCLVVAWSVVLPLLAAMTTGTARMPWKSLSLPAGADIFGRSGIEEFIPCRVEDGLVLPVAAKSSYVGVLRRTDGFIRLGPGQETLRQGAYAEVCLC